MAAKKTKKVTVEIDVEVLEKLLEAVEAISELASAAVHGADDPDVRAKLTKSGKGAGGKGGAKKRAKK
jgi:hypothetical protein